MASSAYLSAPILLAHSSVTGAPPTITLDLIAEACLLERLNDLALLEHRRRQQRG